jgi:hypothetical protein
MQIGPEDRSILTFPPTMGEYNRDSYTKVFFSFHHVETHRRHRRRRPALE